MIMLLHLTRVDDVMCFKCISLHIFAIRFLSVLQKKSFTVKASLFVLLEMARHFPPASLCILKTNSNFGGEKKFLQHVLYSPKTR